MNLPLVKSKSAAECAYALVIPSIAFLVIGNPFGSWAFDMLGPLWLWFVTFSLFLLTTCRRFLFYTWAFVTLISGLIATWGSWYALHAQPMKVRIQARQFHDAAFPIVLEYVARQSGNRPEWEFVVHGKQLWDSKLTIDIDGRAPLEQVLNEISKKTDCQFEWRFSSGSSCLVGGPRFASHTVFILRPKGEPESAFDRLSVWRVSPGFAMQGWDLDGNMRDSNKFPQLQRQASVAPD